MAPGALMRRGLQVLLGSGGAASRSSSAEQADLAARVERLEATVAHLEAALEGLQDAVHRRSRLDDQRNDELLRRTAPGSSDSDPSGAP